ncbi:hypothetical protein Q2T40_18070 [Winogradskyella maritima]|uniref:TolB family protein n=1 Tax=Winogradskyella maritima TaxID=1517766 RepID=A0ABV8AH40_9FLAO|nr:hypothetical protein [Winogradskyella maritima]
MKFFQLALIMLCVVSCQDGKESANTSKTASVDYSQDTIQPVIPEILSKFKSIRDFTINGVEDEAYFTLQSPLNEISVIMKLSKSENGWSSPEMASFSGRYSDLEPFFSPDYLRLYFSSNRPVSKDSSNIKDFDIWYVERSSVMEEWSQPVNVGTPVNTKADEFYPAITLSKSLYFTAITEETGPGDDIFVSTWNGNRYETPKQLSDSINTKGAEFNAYVSPDESYILFGGWRRPDGIGAGDIYISEKKNGIWQKAKNLGIPLNSENTDYCPFVNTETNTLYFTSRRSGLKGQTLDFKILKSCLESLTVMMMAQVKSIKQTLRGF